MSSVKPYAHYTVLRWMSIANGWICTRANSLINAIYGG